MLCLRSQSDVAGDRADDFHHTADGELLTLPAIVCEGDAEHAAACGCDRSFVGVATGLACTVGVAEEVPEAEARVAIRDGEGHQGWVDLMGEAEAFAALWRDFADLSAALAQAGVVVGQRVRIHSTPNTYQLGTEVAA